MVYIAYFTELILQICDYAQKRRICRKICKYAPDENFHGHFCPRRKAAKFCYSAWGSCCWRPCGAQHNVEGQDPVKIDDNVGNVNEPFWVCLLPFNYRAKHVNNLPKSKYDMSSICDWNTTFCQVAIKILHFSFYSTILPVKKNVLTLLDSFLVLSMALSVYVQVMGLLSCFAK